MKILSKDIEKDGSGTVKLQPETREDMWHIYNLLGVNDRIKTVSFRKVQNVSDTGSTTSQRVKLHLCIAVEDIDYDAAVDEIRIKGKTTEEHNLVRLGSYHTISLILHRKFTLEKGTWDAIHLERLEEASHPEKQADVGAIVMEHGLAHVCLVSSHMTHVVAKVEKSIPRKRAESSSKHDKAVERFYDLIAEAIVQNFDFDVIQCVIVASPAFIKDEFLQYLFTRASKKDEKPILKNRKKFIAVHCSSGHKMALKEVLADPLILEQMRDTKAAREVQALNDFFDMLNVDPDRAYYGYDHVLRATQENAVDRLLVTDDLFRSADLAVRKKYVALVEKVQENGGTVFIFSSMHESGRQLSELTGIASLLRFPLPEIDEES